jgi:hypothetical protein
MLTSLVAIFMTACNVFSVFFPHTTNCPKHNNPTQPKVKCRQMATCTTDWKDLHQFCYLPDARARRRPKMLDQYQEENIGTG